MLNKILLSLVIVLLLVLQVIQPWASTEGQEEKSAVPQETPSLDVMPPLESVEKKIERNLADASSAKSPEEEVDQRLMRLEQKLERLLDTEKRIKEANKGVRDDVTFYTSIVANGFNALAVFAAILALFAINIYFAFKERIKNDEKEIKSILKKAHKYKDLLEKELSKEPLTEKFTKKILEIARKTAIEGTGIEVLRAQAVLAQEENRWQDALTYWRSMLKVFPEDSKSLFGASLAALKLAKKATGERQKYYINCAEFYFKKFLPKNISTAVYTNWGLLCSLQAQLAKNSAERKRFFDLATSKFQCATEKNPHHAATWSNWGNLCVDQANAAENAKERESFLAMAEAKYERATQENPHHAISWFNRACLAALRNLPAECVQLLEQWREIQQDASLDILDNDEDFNLVRNSKEFLDFRDKLEKKSS